jgi:hypothetical protein
VTFQPVLSMPRFGALAVGALCFGVFYVLFSWAIISRLSPAIVTALFWSMFVAPGFVVGFIARTTPVMHGLILAVLAGLLMPLEPVLHGGVTHSIRPVDILPIVRAMVRKPYLGAWLVVAGAVLCPPGAILGTYAGRKLRGLQ